MQTKSGSAAVHVVRIGAEGVGRVGVGVGICVVGVGVGVMTAAASGHAAAIHGAESRSWKVQLATPALQPSCCCACRNHEASAVAGIQASSATTILFSGMP